MLFFYNTDVRSMLMVLLAFKGIPFKSTATQRGIFASCKDPLEIWPLVVEKAFAKVHAWMGLLDRPGILGVLL